MINQKKALKKILIVILFLAIGSVLFLYSDKTAYSANVTIGGDVYSGGNLGNNITINNNSVASASGNVEALGNNYKIGNSPRTINLDDIDKIIPKLKTLHPQPISSISGDNFELNTNGFPEGTVWVANNGLTISKDTTFSGKGTIIVENGNLKIDGNISYADKSSSIGFIVNGDITIKSNVTKLNGAYYATGTITIE